MSSSMSDLDKAHEHASSASDHYSRGLLIPAAEEHYKAAEAFKTCIEKSTDEHAKNTLQKLYAHHNNAGKDLQRRIAKLKEEGKDPSLPQVSSTSRSTAKGGDSGSILHSQLRGRTIDSSTNTFDESFMVLNQQTEPAGEESPFDLFWKVTGEIMVNLSQPMTIQTALAALDAVENRSNSGQGSASRSVVSESSKQSSKTRSGTLSSSRNISKKDDFDIDDDEYDSSDSFCLVPSTSESVAEMTRLKKENASLKTKLEAMENQMASVKRQINMRNVQDQQLRDNIILARKEAQRAMAASTTLGNPQMQSMMGLAGLNFNSNSQLGVGRDREAQLQKRIRELEDEVRSVRAENEKQKAMIAKFRERWERLKESAKRKKSAKAAGITDSSSVRERIDEDPEAEAAATAEEENRDGL